MDLTALRTFAAVATHGSVTAAASELHTVQSNVTARLKALEADLDVRLFERHARGMRPTSAGQRLLAYAQRVEALVAEARAAVVDDRVARGPLRIGSMETTAAVRLPGCLAAFHRGHPDVQLELRTGPTAELLELLLAHRLDAALVAAPLDHPELVAHSAFHEELVLVSAKDSAGIDERLARQRLTAIVFRQGCSYRLRLEALFAARGWLPFRRLEMGTVEGMLGCVAADVGVTLLPRSVVEVHREACALRVEPFAPALHVDTLLVRRADVPAGAALRAFEASLGG